jgi:GNAT superfamily N-acetyltransferase
MTIRYTRIQDRDVGLCRELCNELMAFQKSKTRVAPERFDTMSFETRMLPSIHSALYNYLVVVHDDEEKVGYVYANISPKETYVNDFATFFDLTSVKAHNVGCLSQFYLKEAYRHQGIGSILIDRSLGWLHRFKDVEDYFVFVSNGNDGALQFYERNGFRVSHTILDGFITVLRMSRNDKSK